MISNGLAVEFAVTGDDCPLAAATGAAGTTARCRPPPQLRRDGNVLHRLVVRSGGRALAEALDGDDRASHVFVVPADGGHTVRFLSTAPCVLHTLTDAGFLPETVEYADGVGRFRGAVVGREVLRNVLRAAGEAVGVSLRNLHRIEDEAGAGEDGPAERWNLTPAQAEALRAGHRMGYFRSPRAVTAEEVAADLQISKSAYLQRVQRAEAALLEYLFGDESPE